MPDPTPEIQNISEVKPPRADIAEIVGLSPQRAAEIATQQSQEAQRIANAKANGRRLFTQLSEGPVDQITLGSGQFGITPPIEKPHGLVPAVAKRTKEINPPPPEDEVKAMLDGVAEEALREKDYETATACANYITDEKLIGSPQLQQLIDAAATDEEKFNLAKALEQIIPQPSPVIEISKQLPIQPEVNQDPQTPTVPYAQEKPPQTTAPNQTTPSAPITPENGQILRPVGPPPPESQQTRPGFLGGLANRFAAPAEPQE